MQRSRDRAARELRIAAFEHRPRQLLDEQRDAAGALDHCRDSLVGQCFSGRYFSNHRAHVARAQPV